MDALSSIAPIVAALGAVGALVSFTLKYLSSRGTHFLERTRGLLEMKNLVQELGEVTGPAASVRAAEAHLELVQSYEVEVRANAILYLRATARLKRPGSIITPFLWIGYSVFVFFVLSNELSAATFLATNPILNTIGGIALGLVALAVLVVAIVTVIRRFVTRSIRKEMGHIDDLTLEGAGWVWRAWEKWRTRARANRHAKPGS